MYYKVNRNTTKQTALSKLDNSNYYEWHDFNFFQAKLQIWKNYYTFSDDFMVEFYEGTR